MLAQGVINRGSGSVVPFLGASSPACCVREHYWSPAGLGDEGTSRPRAGPKGASGAE